MIGGSPGRLLHAARHTGAAVWPLRDGKQLQGILAGGAGDGDAFIQPTEKLVGKGGVDSGEPDAGSRPTALAHSERRIWKPPSCREKTRATSRGAWQASTISLPSYPSYLRFQIPAREFPVVGGRKRTSGGIISTAQGTIL